MTLCHTHDNGTDRPPRTLITGVLVVQLRRINLDPNVVAVGYVRVVAVGIQGDLVYHATLVLEPDALPLFVCLLLTILY